MSYVDGEDRVYVGQQFVFLDAEGEAPLAVAVDGEPQTFLRPTAISRHRHRIGFGEMEDEAPPWDWGWRGGVWPRADLPRLEAPALAPLAVITERKIYRPDDEVRFFVVAPDLAGGQVSLEVQLAGERIFQQDISLDAAGLALIPFDDLQEGIFEVIAHRNDRDVTARTTFTVAEFSLSPLVALLERFTLEEGRLRFRLAVQQLNAPYDGRAELGLLTKAGGERAVASKKVRVKKGAVEASFKVQPEDGPFYARVTTPGGETALVAFPGTEAIRQPVVCINPLGRTADALLTPGKGTRQVRGLHIRYADEVDTPFRLESAVAAEARLVSRVRTRQLQVVAFDPLTGQSTAQDFEDVRRGETIAFDVTAPYSLFTLGAFTQDGPYEAWGVVVRPVDLQATLVAPGQAEPGEYVEVTVEADRPARCLLLVYDARLEHESPLPQLGRRLHTVLRDATSPLAAAAPPPARQVQPSWPPPGAVLRSTGILKSIPLAMAAAPRMEAAPDFALAPAPSVKAETAVEAPVFAVAPSRENFPELAYLELFDVSAEGRAERVVPLGDQIGTWRCRAYLFAGLDVCELTADISAEKTLFAELDLPAIVGQGDEIEVAARYLAPEGGKLSIFRPGAEPITVEVAGSGIHRFALTEPGMVEAHLAAPDGDDWTRREVAAPGIQKVTVSRLDILLAGQTVTGERVVVYPGVGPVLADAIEALYGYPFG
ncbi:MAG: hypothetical protein JSV36_15660 [Anaerolineae bacterium]|nr:MAG: hypothetical protein JSV36_15660 [Anaerolineae bacterium]